MICFEHAFPEIATTLALDGAQVLVIPSAVPVGYEHLLALRTRARAQDSQVFAVASNLAEDGFCGGSMIVDPRGEIAAAQAEEAAIGATIDLEAIQRERRREPALRLRRVLYREPGPPPGRPRPWGDGRDQGFLPTRNQVTISPLPLTSIGPRRSNR